MKRVLVTGADGFVGRALSGHLADAGYEVIPVVRIARKPGDIAVGDLGSYTEWSTPLRGVDAVMHLAARAHVTKESSAAPLSEFRRINVAATRRLAEASVAAGVQRFVFVSSIGVNGTFSNDRAFRESDAPRPTEPYSISKWEAEQQLLELATRSSLQLTRVRPPLVVGPQAKGNLHRLMRLVASGMPMPLGAVKNERSFVALDDLCRLLTLCISRPEAAGELLLAANEPAISTPELLRQIAQAMGRRIRLPAVPVWALSAVAVPLGFAPELKRLTSSLTVDASHARETLSWRPAADSLSRGIAAMVASYEIEKGT